ncbi:alpha/beta hydrolase [Actinocorallia populi]|uniref:alpha/beta hydrolase n=1 Tax=Actinocorallia populi TaxID=2079200 RepID=UPI000D08B479|nr:alpha/beta hydrolase [Actinocorallia populi]
MRKLIAFAALAATLAGTASVPASAHAPEPALSWGTCVTGPDDEQGRELEKAGAECAELDVPLDHADPRGHEISLGLSRIKATGRRIGTLMVNTGGPGGQAMAEPPFIRDALKDVGTRYDIVGMDPRFVGRSTPLDCGWPTGTWIRSAGLTRASFNEQVEFQRDLAQRCTDTNGSALPHVTTRNTARDMDAVRTALGEEKISYLGYSYGTYLGAVYHEMFPGRLDRIVLDGALDPAYYGNRLLRNALDVSDRVLGEWSAWTAERDDRYHLGRTRAAVLATVERLVRASSRKPLQIGSYQVDDTLLPVVLINLIADDRDPSRKLLAETVRSFQQAARHRPVTPPDELLSILGSLTTSTDSAYGSVQASILCGDVAVPRDPEVYWRDVQATRRRSPILGPVVEHIGPCAFWNTAPREAPTSITADAPALIVNARGDTRTTLASAQALHARWPSSRLITLDASTHGIFGYYGSTCVDDAIIDYFRTGALPAADSTCPS